MTTLAQLWLQSSNCTERIQRHLSLDNNYNLANWVQLLHRSPHADSSPSCTSAGWQTERKGCWWKRRMSHYSINLFPPLIDPLITQARALVRTPTPTRKQGAVDVEPALIWLGCCLLLSCLVVYEFCSAVCRPTPASPLSAPTSHNTAFHLSQQICKFRAIIFAKVQNFYFYFLERNHLTYTI